MTTMVDAIPNTPHTWNPSHNIFVQNTICARNYQNTPNIREDNILTTCVTLAIRKTSHFMQNTVLPTNNMCGYDVTRST